MRRKGRLVLGIFLCLVVLASLIGIGCGAAKNEEPAQGGEEQKLTLRLATQHPVEHMATKSAEKIKEKIEKETNGRITVTVYPANQLGDYTQIYEEIMRGTIDMAHISVPDQFDARLSIGFLPYIGRDYAEIEKVFTQDSYLYNEVSKMHEKLGVKFLGYYGEGFGGIGCAKMPQDPVNFNADKGLLVRVPPMDVFKLAAEDLGFRTTTIPYAETYSALQTGVADGWVGGPPNLNYMWFRDVIKVFLQYNNSFESTSYLMNLKLWNSLSPEDQKIIADAFGEQCKESFTLAEQEDKMYRDKLKEEGIEVVEFSPDELKAMADHVREVTWPKLTKNLTEELVNGLKASY
ncbi:TRAP transporter substrate-binding protein DctP [Candidatus Formimonas warabiya]|uniref:Uncharacterized protein n=1 Tax=Formimonas warabiya TaxID=1761012 RepID=A0A3G1KWW2_FORW1|nr:TRAP transporter substrate-binding protein DctP [Candidatus Formimonas warabiya]ATW27023.1 hypothetical protein DCMF_21675 [Candidatus Formimonas warabiya]